MAALYKQQLGTVIATRRKSLGLSQKELASRAGIEESQTVSRWERGLNAPIDLDAVARALETTAPEMLKELEPIGNSDRKRLDRSSGTQLDRIEATQREIIERLDELLERMTPGRPSDEELDDLVEVVEETARPPSTGRREGERKRAATSS